MLLRGSEVRHHVEVGYGAFLGTEAAGDLELRLHDADIPLSEIVVERNIRFVDESGDFRPVLFQTEYQRTFLPA